VRICPVQKPLSIADVTRSAVCARRCPFCGSPADSDEHLLPAWLANVLPADEPAVHFLQLHDATDRKEWERRPFRESAKVVCGQCNNGWMHRLEEASKPIMRPGLRRQRFAIGTGDQRTLALWAVKTVLVFQAALMRQPLAPLDHFTLLRDDRPPPSGISVWLGSHARARTDPSSAVYLQSTLDLSTTPKTVRDGRNAAYFAFLAVGGLSFVVLGLRDAHDVCVDIDGPLADAAMKLWPNQEPQVQWPPELMLDQDHVRPLLRPPGIFTLSAR
jgi:hypothetical protein